MRFRAPIRLLFLAVLAAPSMRAAERITLRNGFELDCSRREIMGDRVRLYLNAAGGANFVEVAADAIVAAEAIEALPSQPTVFTTGTAPVMALQPLNELLTYAGRAHHIDADMLASIVQAESGGHARAVSRTGARGLMQLMPGTAAHLGVTDSFEPSQNIAGGSAYLDQLLTRYHDDIALALAAYNAGPGAVDRYRGIPPYRETRLYVARVINEYNRRKRAALQIAEVTSR